MNKIALRGVLALALVISIAAKVRSIAARDELAKTFDIRSNIISELNANNLPMLENPVKPPKLLSRVVYFQRPGCDRRSVIMPLSFNLEAAPLLVRVAPAGYTRLYAYAGVSSAEQNRVRVFLEWIKQSVLTLIGTSRYVPVKLAIVVAEPPECAQVPVIDWRKLWDRQHLAAKLHSNTGALVGPQDQS